MTDVELKKAMHIAWLECQKANGLYYKAREAALTKAIKPLEPLRVACDETINAYKVLQAEFMKRTRRV